MRLVTVWPDTAEGANARRLQAHMCLALNCQALNFWLPDQLPAPRSAGQTRPGTGL